MEQLHKLNILFNNTINDMEKSYPYHKLHPSIQTYKVEYNTADSNLNSINEKLFSFQTKINKEINTISSELDKLNKQISDINKKVKNKNDRVEDYINNSLGASKQYDDAQYQYNYKLNELILLCGGIIGLGIGAIMTSKSNN